MTVDRLGDTHASRRPRSRTVRWARRAGVTLAGGILLIAGAVMLVAPGPGILVLLLGLLVLSTEYAWARRQLDRHRGHAARARASARRLARRVRRRARASDEPTR
jgi:uncharacterized protein (TIGR02611 family)